MKLFEGHPRLEDASDKLIRVVAGLGLAYYSVVLGVQTWGSLNDRAGDLKEYHAQRFAVEAFSPEAPRTNGDVIFGAAENALGSLALAGGAAWLWSGLRRKDERESSRDNFIRQ